MHIGNVVRVGLGDPKWYKDSVQIKVPNIGPVTDVNSIFDFDPAEAGLWAVTMYFKISSIADDWIEGVCDDEHGSDATYPIKDGQKIWFQRKHIWEVPLDWPMNIDIIK